MVCDDGVKLGFPSRELAVAAASAMVDMHRLYGVEAELLVQDEVGGLKPMVLPMREPEPPEGVARTL